MPDDAKLLRGLRAGKEWALGELVSRYGTRVLSICRQMLFSAEEAEEATQDVFLTAWQRARDFRGESSLHTWLYGIAVHKCLHRRRGAGRLRAALARMAEIAGWGPSYQTLMGAPRPPTAPDSAAERQEQRIQIQRALARVPGTYRAALILREWEGMSYEEIAAATGAGVGTVKSRIRRGRLALAVAFRELEGKP